MKKIYALVMVALLGVLMSACGPAEVELPPLHGMDKDAIRTVLEMDGIEVHFFVDDSREMSSPHMFVRYMNHNIGDMVNEGDRVTVIVSSGLDDIDEDELEPAPLTPLDPGGHFVSVDDVSLYIDTFGTLPDNYITLEEAFDMGYDEDEENLGEVAEGMSIGGHEFDSSDYDILPNGGERTYFIADVNHEVGERADEFLVYSDDGIIYHTADDFATFDQLFGTEEHPPQGLEKDGEYTRRSEVALYIRTFGRLPKNYLIRYPGDTSLYESYIGDLPDFYDDYDFPQDLVVVRREYGDQFEKDIYYGYWHFSNHAGQLPRSWTFMIADINIAGAGHSRGNDRFVFSPEAKIVYYTPDHFNTYEILYGDARD